MCVERKKAHEFATVNDWAFFHLFSLIAVCEKELFECYFLYMFVEIAIGYENKFRSTGTSLSLICSPSIDTSILISADFFSDFPTSLMQHLNRKKIHNGKQKYKQNIFFYPRAHHTSKRHHLSFELSQAVVGISRWIFKKEFTKSQVCLFLRKGATCLPF